MKAKNLNTEKLLVGEKINGRFFWIDELFSCSSVRARTTTN